MEPIKPPRTFKVYALVKQDGLHLSQVYTSSTTFGSGFHANLTDAEHVRTLEMLKETSNKKIQYHIFELEIPNPACQE